MKKLKGFIKITGLLLFIFGLFSFLRFAPLINEPVSVWLTTTNQSQALSQQASVSFSADAGTNSNTIIVNDATAYQTIDGFGYAFTEGSAELISSLTATMQDSILNDIFNPVKGIGVSIVRISIGASDLSSSIYSYNNTSGDVNMANFSLAGPDLTYLIPMLKKMLAINPNIKILATPWSAPAWMKSNNNSSGGNLNTGSYAAYANYFVKYIQAMKAQGLTIWGVTPQNEPENAGNNPSMTMNSTEETNFINNNLGPALQNAALSTKIIGYDHNCDDTNYPTAVANNSTYVDGTAFHLYAGDISAMSTVYNATNKNVYFTELYTAIGGDFGNDFDYHIQNVIIGACNNWAKTSIEWNLASDPNGNPHTSGGCSTCLGAVTINNSTSYTRNVAYYIIGHAAKFVNAGAQRIASNSTNKIQDVAFKNTDGSIVLVALNTGNSSTNFKVKWGSQSFSYTLAKGAVASFKWYPATTVPVTFSSFDVLKQGTKAAVEFVTATERGNAYFVIERSGDGLQFASIGQIAAKGNNTNGASYNFIDEHPLDGTGFYRIRAVDKDGNEILSTVKQVVISNRAAFIISPNPVGRDRAMEIRTKKNTMVGFKLFDVSGKQVYANNVATNSNLYLPQLTKGVYIYSIATAGESNAMGKVVLF